MLGPDVTQRLIAVLIVVGLGVGVWLLWPRDESESPTTTSPLGAASTTTDPLPGATTTSEPAETTTLTSVGDGHVVETVEEAEAILRELWFGWFEGIYNQDEDRIRQVVASQQMLDAAREAFGAEFERAPDKNRIVVSNTEVLTATTSCLVVWMKLDVTAFRDDKATSENLVVLRSKLGDWLLFSTWVNRGDLWEADCDALLEPLQ